MMNEPVTIVRPTLRTSVSVQLPSMAPLAAAPDFKPVTPFYPYPLTVDQHVWAEPRSRVDDGYIVRLVEWGQDAFISMGDISSRRKQPKGSTAGAAFLDKGFVAVVVRIVQKDGTSFIDVSKADVAESSAADYKRQYKRALTVQSMLHYAATVCGATLTDLNTSVAWPLYSYQTHATPWQTFASVVTRGVRGEPIVNDTALAAVITSLALQPSVCKALCCAMSTTAQHFLLEHVRTSAPAAAGASPPLSGSKSSSAIDDRPVRKRCCFANMIQEFIVASKNECERRGFWAEDAARERAAAARAAAVAGSGSGGQVPRPATPRPSTPHPVSGAKMFDADDIDCDGDADSCGSCSDSSDSDSDSDPDAESVGADEAELIDEPSEDIKQHCSEPSRIVRIHGVKLSCAQLASILHCQLDTVEYLELSDCGLTDHGARILRLLSHAEHLTCLNLSDNDIGPEGLMAMMESLVKAKNLKRLILASNPCLATPPSVSRLVTTLIGDMVTIRVPLKELDLRQTGITDESIPVLSALFHCMPSLHHMNLQGNHLTDFGVVAVADAMSQAGAACHLRRLNLLYGRYGMAGLSALAEAAVCVPTLEELPWSLHSGWQSADRVVAYQLSQCLKAHKAARLATRPTGSPCSEMQ